MQFTEGKVKSKMMVKQRKLPLVWKERNKTHFITQESPCYNYLLTGLHLTSNKKKKRRRSTLRFSKLPKGYRQPASIKLTAAEHSDASHNLLLTIYAPLTFSACPGTSNATQFPPHRLLVISKCPSQCSHDTWLGKLRKK